MKNFVISLATNNTKRRAHIIKEFGTQKISFEFFDAITPIDNDKLLKKYHLDKKHSELTPGATSCLLSHYAIWQKIIKENINYAGIFEDDIYLGENAGDFIMEQKWASHNFHILKLERGTQETIDTSPFSKKIGNRIITRLKSGHYCTAGYIITKKGAQFLLNAYKQTAQLVTVDKFIFEELIQDSRYKVFQVLPALCIQDGILNSESISFPTTLPPPENKYLEASTLTTKKKSIKAKIRREVIRPFKQIQSLVRKLLYTRKNRYK